MIGIAQAVLVALLALAFVGMGVMHFVPSAARGMAAMIPERMRVLPARVLVQFTGVCEILGGIGLAVPATRLAAGIALIVFLVAVFPANVVAAKDPDRFGAVAIPFWPRWIGQVVLVLLVALAIV